MAVSPPSPSLFTRLLASLMLVGTMACGGRSDVGAHDLSDATVDVDVPSTDAGRLDGTTTDSPWVPCTDQYTCSLLSARCDQGLCCRGWNVAGACVCGNEPGCGNVYSCCKTVEGGLYECVWDETLLNGNPNYSTCL